MELKVPDKFSRSIVDPFGKLLVNSIIGGRWIPRSQIQSGELDAIETEVEDVLSALSTAG